MHHPKLRLSAVVLATTLTAACRAAPETSSVDVLAELKRLDQSPTTAPAGPDAHARAERKAALVRQLIVADPLDPAAFAYLATRWHNMQMSHSPALAAEADAAVAGAKSADLAAEAYVCKFNLATFAATSREEAYATLRPVLDAFAARAPGSKYLSGAYAAVAAVAPDPAVETDLLRQAVATATAPRDAEGPTARLKTLDLIGKPLALEFDDAATGRHVRLADLKGKVVVLDFWATWCGPCVREMPALKTLYAQYKDAGVEFIGVSLDLPEDEGGLDKLKAFIKANDIAWPQFYQGKSWDADFSGGLGVMRAPTKFVIDRQGNVKSVDAGDQLPKMLADLTGKPATQP